MLIDCQGEESMANDHAMRIRTYNVLAILCSSWLSLAMAVDMEPANLQAASGIQSAISFQTGTFPFVDIEVHYKLHGRMDSGDPVVLFLHGKAFTSDTWFQLGTLEKVAQAGFKAMAVDLPDFGRTQHLPYVDNNMRAEFIKAALEFAVQGRNQTSVLVSPSMSGRWAIPFLDRYGQMLGGWVAVAPVGITGWGGPWEFTHKQVKLLAVYGEKDAMKSDGPYLSKLLLDSRLVVLPGAGHACYLDQPQAFHDALLQFIKRIDPHFLVLDKYHQNGL